jgi:DNA-binding SARP family transcriptional activator
VTKERAKKKKKKTPLSLIITSPHQKKDMEQLIGMFWSFSTTLASFSQLNQTA